MKRTRRIEVIRYTRRSMVVEGCYTVSDPTATAQPVIEVSHEDPADSPHANKEPGDQITRVSVDAMSSGLELKLRDLLRLRR